MKVWGWSIVAVFLNGCGLIKHHPAPVEMMHQNRLAAHQYRVQMGDNLNLIAWVYQLPLERLAHHNHLRKPYVLKAGQILDLRVPHTHTEKAHVRHVAHTTRQAAVHPKTVHVTALKSPLRHGRFIAAAYPYHGAFILSHQARFVRAMHAGRVVYGGDGIKGYGHMLLIKTHHADEVIAYAFNRRHLVHVGQQVRQGQRIAEVGMLPQKQLGVYIEVRHHNRPLSPQQIKRHLR